MKMLFAGLILASTAACATMAEDGEAGGSGNYVCNAEGLEALVGQTPTAELGAEALRRSNSRTLRWIRPGDAVTMDLRQDRLNIHIDARNRVERFACG